MTATTLIKRANKTHSIRFERNAQSFSALLVVYEVESGEWRGFAHPYGETTEASSKEEAIKKLRALTDAYHGILVKYGSPQDLANGHIENLMDREVFSWVISNKSLMEGVHSKSGNADSQFCYVEAYRSKS